MYMYVYIYIYICIYRGSATYPWTPCRTDAIDRARPFLRPMFSRLPSVSEPVAWLALRTASYF